MRIVFVWGWIVPYPVSDKFAHYGETHNNILSIYTSLNQQASCTRDRLRVSTKIN